MPINANERLLDEATRHQVDVARYENHLVRRVIAVLLRSDERLVAELREALERGSSTARIDRLEAMLAGVRAVNAAAYAEVSELLRAELSDFMSTSLAFESQLLVHATPVVVNVATVQAEAAYAAALSRPFQGALLREFLAAAEPDRAQRVRRAVAQGFVEGKTNDQIVREIRGTRAKGYADGALAIPRRDAERVVRTAVQHIAGFAQDRVAEANAELIRAVRWSSTIDLRTSPICQVRDGKLYDPVTHKPIKHSIPWLAGPGRAHWCCRSSQVYVLKSAEELGLGSPDIVLRDGTRATMDGQVPEETTYLAWIQRQSAARQDEVLGATRGKLLRAGKLPAADLYNRRGEFLTLEELRAKDAAAFRRAGV